MIDPKLHSVFHQAMLSKDARFDGRFFTAVKTTGVYCRPVCPAKAKPENMIFYETAAEAEQAGFRPCLRCRPESAPGSAAWVGSVSIVKRALKHIESEDFFSLSEDEFAGKFGMSARHLRRMFNESLGRTPKQLAINHRLNFSRKLVLETSLPIIDIAFSSGFESLRRFNDAFKKRFCRSPRDFRCKLAPDAEGEEITLQLSYRPPFHWSGLLRFYRDHHVGGIEEIDDDSYTRYTASGDSLAIIRVKNAPERNALLLNISGARTQSFHSIANRIRSMFDLDADPLTIEQSLGKYEPFGTLTKKYPGLRLPGGWDRFETCIYSILGQLVSITQARALAKQLVEQYGEIYPHSIAAAEGRLFPSPAKLATCDLARLKTTANRKNTIRGFSQWAAEGGLDKLAYMPQDERVRTLLSLKGIGKWTAEVIGLRAFCDTDSMPKTDLILKRALEQFPKLDPEKLRPWGSYAAMLLWREYAGVLSKSKTPTA
ncbi:MAG: DNA-3-methyladenine glycosylase 2 family protein [Verrucomicrobia bacterium]|nr:MAG: DNA-3-methyladenine glycosylase 2 family protein [Verrucomicrobiota bacterium]